VNEKKGFTSRAGLRSILRPDPEKIMVGEIRDQETAQIAINSALTGHLVFTTVHANNVVDVLGPLLNIGVVSLQLRFGAELHPRQRLVRVNCEHCKHPSNIPDQRVSRAVSIPPNGPISNHGSASASNPAHLPAARFIICPSATAFAN